MSRRNPNLAELAAAYAESVCKRMENPDAPVLSIKYEVAMAYLAGALRVVDGKPKEAP